MNCLVCANEINGVFYSSLDHKGELEIYCYGCYQKVVLDNYPHMNAQGTLVGGEKCECGKEKHGFASHSQWCPKS